MPWDNSDVIQKLIPSEWLVLIVFGCYIMVEPGIGRIDGHGKPWQR